MGKKPRLANYEALRIVAMLMVITMHYLQKGGLLAPLSESLGLPNLAAWLVEAFSIGAANAYVLISGYFLAEAAWSWKKLLSLIAQIWGYSVGVPLICLGLGLGNVAEWELYDWVTVILPLQSEHYWFATAYVIMYLFVPVLQTGVRKLSQKQFQTMLLCLVLFFSLGKSLLPVALPTDRYGYDYGWFVCLFLAAAYFRLYGFPWMEAKGRPWVVYAGSAILIWLLGAGAAIFEKKGLPLSYAGDMLYSYNHVLVLVLSAALFMAFGQLTVKKELLEKGIIRLAPYSFGVYLLHENIAVRYLWQSWAGVEKVQGSLLFIPHMLVTVCLIYAIGAGVDFLRSRIAAGAIKVWKRKREE